MKKISLIVVIVLGVFILSGCDKKKEKVKENKNVDISYILGKGKITVSVPKEKNGKPKYKFTEEKPEGISVPKTFYLVTDKSIIGFATTGFTYHTSAKYKEKYKDEKASFDGYLKYIEDKDLFNKSYLPGLEKFKINNRKALRYYNRSGSPDNYKYYGYFYMIDVDDIYVGSKFDMVVNYKSEEKPSSVKEFDKETLKILNSLRIKLNEK